jgi:hypothetical protein
LVAKSNLNYDIEVKQNAVTCPFYMRIVAILFLLSILAVVLKAQPLPSIYFHGQPTLTKSISVEPYALFYEDPTGDTLQL